MDMMPFSQCKTCQLPFREFFDRINASFGLDTPASDDSNVQLQTHGILGNQLKFLQQVLKGSGRRLYQHKDLAKTHFPPSCRNPIAMGFAGSLRGLPFHSHQGNWNEAVVGRKLFAMYPPRAVDSATPNIMVQCFGGVVLWCWGRWRHWGVRCEGCGCIVAQVLWCWWCWCVWCCAWCAC